LEIRAPTKIKAKPTWATELPAKLIFPFPWISQNHAFEIAANQAVNRSAKYIGSVQKSYNWANNAVTTMLMARLAIMVFQNVALVVRP